MSRGYSTTAVLSLCALAFFAGCFIQQLPGLPDVSTGFKRSAGSGATGSLRRRVAEVQSSLGPAEGFQNPSARDSNLSGNANPQFENERNDFHNRGRLSELQDAAGDAPRTFDEAATPLLPPPVKPGSSGHSFYTTQPYQLLSWYPRMYLFPKFLDDERCEHIVKLASDKLGPSGLAYRLNDDPTKSRDVRTSSGTFLSRQQDPEGVLAWVEEKIHGIMGIPVSHGEPFNVLRYQLGQHYDSHYDTFDPAEYGPQSSQRIATVLFYLTDVEQGGDTVFPLEGEDGFEVLKHIDYRSCKDGFRYHPRKGDALMFMSIHPNGTFDKHALHGGCPVEKGEKMVMTRWIRDQCHGSCEPAGLRI